MDRRSFLQATVAATAGGFSSLSSGQSPNDQITLGVMGVRGRGGGLLHACAAQPDVAVKYICDLDPDVLAKRTREITDQTGRKPQAIKDFRKILDDQAIDAIVIGTPDHWHALPTIFACQAGKDVYVEKPDGHNVIEGQTMVAAARRHQRIVQLGTQSRSGTFQAAAMKYISAGNLGTVRFAKAWESARQGALSRIADSSPPAGIDYDMWLGPAPQRPFNSRRFHSSWRWFFDYGSGDLGNDGVHRLDVARWGLQTALAATGESLPAIPNKISALGGKHYFDDMQEWPDNLMVTYDYGNCLLTYEMRIWTPHPMFGEGEGAAVYGDEGYVVIGNSGWRAFDRKGKQISEQTGSENTRGHVRNFLDCMRSRAKPNADLETVGHPSSLLCHLGNASWRAGQSLTFDPETYTFVGDDDANRWLTRPEYRAPWKLPAIGDV